MFCDETENLHKKLAGRKRDTTASSRSSSSSARETNETAASICPAELIPSVDEFALSCFYEDHLRRPCSTMASSLYSTDNGLLASFKALGLASCCSTSRAPGLASEAKQFYLTAIQLTNSALASAIEAPKDSTLLTVIVLTYFEAITGGDRRTLTAWSQHVYGTAALIELRGPAQMRTPEGRILFMQASTNIITNCIRLGIRVPNHIPELMAEASVVIDNPKDPMWHVHVASLQVADFYSDVICGRIENNEIVVAEFLRLDHTLAAAFIDVPPCWSYEIITSQQGQLPNGFPGYMHVYQDALSAQIWNSMRCSRMILHWILIGMSRGYFLSLSQEVKPSLIEASTKTLCQLQMDLLATVQQFVVGLPKGHQDSTVKSSPSRDSSPKPETISAPLTSVSPLLEFASSRLPVLRTCPQGYQLQSALALVAHRAATSQIKQAALQMLRRIGSVLGLQQAFTLANALESGRTWVKGELL